MRELLVPDLVFHQDFVVQDYKTIQDMRGQSCPTNSGSSLEDVRCSGRDRGGHDSGSSIVPSSTPRPQAASCLNSRDALQDGLAMLLHRREERWASGIMTRRQLHRCGSLRAKRRIFLDFGPILDLGPQKVAHDPGASFEHLR